MSPSALGRVLVVDDEFQLMDALVEALNAQGYEAHGFPTGVAAIEALQKQEFDLLLTDLMMPGMDGITLLKACLAIDPNLVGILMTGQGTVPTAVEAMRAGAFDYVLKPFRLDALLPVLARAREVQRLRLENIQMRETIAIHNLSQTIALSLDSKLVLQNTADAALQQTGADEVSIMLFKPETDELEISVARGQGREHLIGRHISIQEGIAGWVARQSEPLILNGEVSEPRFAPIQPRPEIRSAILIPMLTAGKLVGVLNVNSLRHLFTLGQVKALSILASTAAAALQNEMLYSALEAREKHFRALTENAPDGITVVDKKGMVIYVSPSVERILGYSQADALGQPAIKFVHPEDSSQLLQQLAQLTNESNQTLVQYRFRHKDGSWRWLESAVSNLIGEPGVDAIIFNYRDITERKQAEETILQLAAIVESSDDAIIGQSLDGMIVNWNSAAERLYGYSSDEVFGKPVSIIFPPEQFDEAIRILERLKAGERIEHFETTRVRKDGQFIHISAAVSSIKDTTGKMIGVSAIERDISERKKAEEILRQSTLQEKGQRRLAVIAELVAIFVVGLTALILELNLNLFTQILINFRVTFAEVDAILILIIFLGLGTAIFSYRRWREANAEIIQRQGVQEALRTLHTELETRVQERTADLAKTNIALKNEITERKQAEEQLRESEERYRFLFESNPLPMWVYDLKTLDFLAVNDWAVEKYGYTREEFLHMTIADIRPAEEVARLMEDVSKQRSPLQRSGDWRHRLKDGTLIDVEITSHTLRIDEHDAALVVAQDVTERKRAEEALQEKEQLLSESQRIGHVGSWSYDITTDTLQYSDEMYRLFDISKETFQHNREDFLSVIYSADRPTVAKWMQVIIAGRQVKELDFRIFHQSGELRYIQIKGAVEFDSNGNPARFIGTAQDISERKLAEIQIRQQLEHLTALRKIDQAITSSFDLLSTLEIVFFQVISQLQVDAVDILLLNPYEHILEYTGGQGFRASSAQNARLLMGESHAGRAAQERRLIQIPNLQEQPGPPGRAPLMAEEGFVAGFFVPLIAKGKVQGVMEMFCRRALQPYPEWLDFLEALAGQTAIAIDNATLFENLQLANSELIRAYDATIEGWSRAMDLRDKETEGHTQRVTDLTLRLAATMNVNEYELIQIRRGALLHDMGKLGVPDNILLKPGKLTDEEWEIMRKHPQFAYEMLSSITYLKPALNIPYCHHEKWDGTGYPRGLKGEQIPLEARIFAVVDVWDAVTSDRPYRKAWSKEEATQYIRGQSEKHFDPKVVEMFLNIVAKM